MKLERLVDIMKAMMKMKLEGHADIVKVRSIIKVKLERPGEMVKVRAIRKGIRLRYFHLSTDSEVQDNSQDFILL